MFLPVNRNELDALGGVCDFVLVTGDAYVDHPSYGAAIIGRLLESLGFIIAVLAQPDWRAGESFKIFGEPRLAFLVTGGNIDSMVNNYTAAKKRRQRDVYSPGNEAGRRPDRAAIVYSNKIRESYKNIPIILGGLEASLRRLSHYDYWDDGVRSSILIDSGADLLVYGMGEAQITEIAVRLLHGEGIHDLTDIRGTVYKTKKMPAPALWDFLILPSFEQVSKSKAKYRESFVTQYKNTDPVTARALVEPYYTNRPAKEAGGFFAVQNPPAPSLSREELDRVYAYPYERTYHPSYKTQGGVSALSEAEFGITSSRGCFGSCNFCALSFHQGRVVRSRSHESIIREAEILTRKSGFKGYIHDVGGPTANFRFAACEKQTENGACRNKRCLYPAPCGNLRVDHEDYLSLLTKLRNLPGVKKVFVRSGIRFDYLMADKSIGFFKELIKHHISGQLKVAPEHVNKKVLDKMGKPGIEVFEKFRKMYDKLNKSMGMKQFLVPYFISSHPGSDLPAAVELAEYFRDNGIRPEQVQDFYPTPGTLSACMYHTETDYPSPQKIYVAKTSRDKAMQRALMQYKLPQNRALVKEALIKAGRGDLIGFSNKCLIKPDKSRPDKNKKRKNDKIKK